MGILLLSDLHTPAFRPDLAERQRSSSKSNRQGKQRHNEGNGVHGCSLQWVIGGEAWLTVIESIGTSSYGVGGGTMRTDLGGLATVNPFRRAAAMKGSGCGSGLQLASPASSKRATALGFGPVVNRV